MKQEKIKSSQVEPARYVKCDTRALLLAKAGGRCELCGELIIKDIVAGENITWGEFAHIYAFNNGGARFVNEKKWNNNIDNLFLACPNCHTKIDKKCLEYFYDVDFLKNRKQKHEKTIKILGENIKSEDTKVLKFIASISDEITEISNKEIRKALIKENLLLRDENPFEIKFRGNGREDPAYWEDKMKALDEQIDAFYAEMKKDKINHTSIFAIGPMPLLAYLGSKLNNKMKTKVFQKHGDIGWGWKKEGGGVEYNFRTRIKGDNVKEVVLLLSLSGLVDDNLIPEAFKRDCTIYEIYIDKPAYTFLNKEKDLLLFKSKFIEYISKIKSENSKLEKIRLFPAAPVSTLVVCGNSLNKNADPEVEIYNFYKKKEYKYALSINKK